MERSKAYLKISFLVSSFIMKKASDIEELHMNCIYNLSKTKKHQRKCLKLVNETNHFFNTLNEMFINSLTEFGDPMDFWANVDFECIQDELKMKFTLKSLYKIYYDEFQGEKNFQEIFENYFVNKFLEIIYNEDYYKTKKEIASLVNKLEEITKSERLES